MKYSSQQALIKFKKIVEKLLLLLVYLRCDRAVAARKSPILLTFTEFSAINICYSRDLVPFYLCVAVTLTGFSSTCFL